MPIESVETPLSTTHNQPRIVQTTGRYNKRRRSCLQWWKILPLPYKIFLILICGIVLLVLYLYLEKLWQKLPKTPKIVPDPDNPLPPSASKLHVFKNGAVCSDSEICSEIGRGILSDDGNIFDAAIATLLCNGVATAQSMGIGGGFIANIYIHSEKKAYTLNAKETAPSAATEDMFKTPEEYLDSVKTIGIPGEIKGYWELHKRYGSKEWKDLVEPTIQLCEKGFPLSLHMRDSIGYRPKLINDNELKKTFFINGTDKPRQPGEHIRLPSALCSTYKILAERGGDDFYNGHLADLIVDDLRDLGSIITKSDLEWYKVRWEESLSLPIDNNTLYVTPLPSGGAYVAFILNILRGYNLTPKSIATDEDAILTYHRFIEAFKFAFGYRTQLSDPTSGNTTEILKKMMSPQFGDEIRWKIDDNSTSSDPKFYGGQFTVVEDKGTSHMSIIAPNGDAISVTSSINLYFGIAKAAKRTGIIFNTGLNDFGSKTMKNYFELPGSPGNYIAPNKRALTSMSPTIMVDNDGEVQLVIGAAGGTRIPTGIASVIARTLWFEQNIKEAVDAPRIHHQLVPMEVRYEYGNTKKLIAGLKLLGHKMHRYDDRGSVICAIAKNQTGIFANADYRKAGEVIGL